MLSVSFSIVTLVMFAYVVSYGTCEKIQHRRCIADGYTRSVSDESIWPHVKCVRLVNGTEQMVSP